VVYRQIDAQDHPTLQYMIGCRPLLTRLRDVLTQAAGFALLVMSQGRRVPMLDVPLALASQELSAVSEELQALPVPRQVRHHYAHAIKAAAGIGQAINLLAVCMRCGSDDPARAALTRCLRVATEHLRAASRLPGFGLVDLRQACCAYHADTLRPINNYDTNGTRN
jgi:ribosomal protein L40E